MRFQKPALFQQEHPVSLYGGSYSDTEVVRQAKAADLITCQVKGSGGHYAAIYPARQIALMKAANPRLKMCVYVNGEETTRSDYPETMYGHTGAPSTPSNRVRHTFGTTLLYDMQSDAKAWHDAVIKDALARFATSTYDGVFIDLLGDMPLGMGMVKPGTNIRYIATEWYDLTKMVGVAVKAALPAGSLVIGNGLGWGGKYLISKRLFTVAGGVDAAMPEIFVRTAGQLSDARPVKQWVLDLAMLTDASGMGKSVVCACKDWVANPTEERIKFAFFTYLLASDGSHFFGASLSQPTTMDSYQWLSSADYGTPSGPYSVLANGVYQREFTKCTVAVNPTLAPVFILVHGRTMSLGAQRGAAFFL